MAQPTQPRWATAQTDPDAHITAPSSGELDDGWLDGQIPPAGYFNWFFNLVYQWIVWLTAAKTKVLTRTEIYNGWVVDLPGDLSKSLTAATAGNLFVDLGMAAGERISSISVFVRSIGAVATDISARWVKTSAAAGAAGATTADVVASTNMPAATANVQAIVLTTGGNVTIAANEVHSVQVAGANSAGAKLFFRVEVTYLPAA